MTTKKEPGKRTLFEISMKLDYLPGGIEGLIRICEDDDQVVDYALIIHDQDEAEPHVHLFLRMKTSCPFSTVARKFGIPVQNVEKVKSTFGRALCYMTHCDGSSRKEGKHLYHDHEVVSNFEWQLERNQALEGSEKKFSDKAVELMVAGGKMRLCDVDSEIPEAQILRIGSRRLGEAAEVYGNKMGYDCEQETVLITGPSGSGKTVLSKYMAESAGKGQVYMSGNEKDPWEYYRGQSVAILDDFRPNHMSLTEFLRLTDPHTMTPVHSRYHSKRPVLDLLIITTILSLDDFFKGFQGADGEDPTQVKRRLQRIIELTGDEMIITENGTTDRQNFVLSDYLPS